MASAHSAAAQTASRRLRGMESPGRGRGEDAAIVRPGRAAHIGGTPSRARAQTSGEISGDPPIVRSAAVPFPSRMIYLVVGLDRRTLGPWHRNIGACDVTTAKRLARVRARAAGVD